MQVQLYVYDLSQGLARQMSRQFLGVQIDAVYHTSLVFGGIEYFFGAGVQTTRAGTTHHGRPMDVVSLGETDLPLEVILEYLESLKETYTPESYDLFAHNCNNFTNDFAMFLTGHGIPAHITSLPKQVLDTPFGQMLRPQIERSLRPVTQAPPQSTPLSPSQKPPTMSANAASSSNFAAMGSKLPDGRVHSVTTLEDLNRLLKSAGSQCAAIFFTSATCPPCKLMYRPYDQLAEEFGAKAVLIKVNIDEAYGIASAYSIRATPTFVTFLKGKKDSQWSGASPPQLMGSLRLLVQSAFPPHRHEKLKLPNFHRASTRFTTYCKVPPLPKLLTKMGSSSQESIVQDVVAFNFS